MWIASDKDRGSLGTKAWVEPIGLASRLMPCVLGGFSSRAKRNLSGRVAFSEGATHVYSQRVTDWSITHQITGSAAFTGRGDGRRRAWRPVGIGRQPRTIPTWLLEQVRWRDQHCRFPGCEATRWLHGHHLVYWSDGGPTNLDNLTLLCGRHHRALHEGDWRLHGDPDGQLTFTAPTGRNYHTYPAVRPERLRRQRRRPHRQPHPGRDPAPADP